MTKIALIYTKDNKFGVQKSFEMLKINPVKGKNAVLKPNFNTADPYPASSDMVTLKEIILKLKTLGAKSITLAERSGPTDTEQTFQQKGVYELAKELNFKVVNLATLPKEEFELQKPKGNHWKDGFLFPKIFLKAEAIIETCCLKTHQYGGHFTLSLKNAVGLVPRIGYDYMKELHSSLNQREMIAEINAIYKPNMIILDGITCFVDGGPMAGTRKDANVFIAGTDKIAIDATAVAILRLLGTTKEVTNGSIFQLEQIKRAVELKIGITSPQEIDFVTDSKEGEKLIKKVKIELEK